MVKIKEAPERKYISIQELADELGISYQLARERLDKLRIPKKKGNKGQISVRVGVIERMKEYGRLMDTDYYTSKGVVGILRGKAPHTIVTEAEALADINEILKRNNLGIACGAAFTRAAYELLREYKII